MRRDVFQAIADPVRREIIEMLAEKPATINAVAEKFSISRPAISKHIKLLEECGIVVVEQTGRERHCHIKPQELIPAFLWLDQYKKLWEDRLDSFEQYLQKLKMEKSKTTKDE